MVEKPLARRIDDLEKEMSLIKKQNEKIITLLEKHNPENIESAVNNVLMKVEKSIEQSLNLESIEKAVLKRINKEFLKSSSISKEWIKVFEYAQEREGKGAWKLDPDTLYEILKSLTKEKDE